MPHFPPKIRQFLTFESTKTIFVEKDIHFNFLQCMIMTNIPQQLALFSENVESDVFKKNARSKQKWAFEKSRHFGLEHCSNAFFQGKFGIVQIKKYTGDLPDKFITLDETNEIGSPSIGVVGYAYDTFLEEYAHNPEKYAYKFSKYKCLGELDFSMKILDPFGAIVCSAMLSHTSAFYYQEHGRHMSTIGTMAKLGGNHMTNLTSMPCQTGILD